MENFWISRIELNDYHSHFLLDEHSRIIGAVYCELPVGKKLVGLYSQRFNRYHNEPLLRFLKSYFGRLCKVYIKNHTFFSKIMNPL